MPAILHRSPAGLIATFIHYPRRLHDAGYVTNFAELV